MKWRHLVVGSCISLAACGKSSSGSNTNKITAPILNGSKNAGLVFTMVPVDSSIATTTLNWYNFTDGSVTQISADNGKDPVVLWSASGKTADYIIRSDKSWHSLKLSSSTATEHSTGSLTNLTAGDPTSWVDIGGGNYLLGNLHGSEIRIFEGATGFVSDPINNDTWDLSATAGKLWPVGTTFVGGAAFTVASSVDFSSDTPLAGSSPAHLFKLDGTSETWTAHDYDASANKAQGVSLNASNPTFVASTTTGNVRAFGLCRSSFGSKCLAGSADVSPTSGTVTTLANFSGFEYEQFSWIVPGPDDDTVYAHVLHTASSQYMIIRVNLRTKAVKELYTFSDSQIYGLFYDQGSDSLMFGLRSDAGGYLAIYKNDTLDTRVLTNAVPWQGNFVPSL